MDEAKVQALVQANNDTLLQKMSDLITSQVSALKRPAEESSTNQIIREIKKIKTAETRPDFKKKSNEKQYNATTKILESLEEADYNLEVHDVPAAKKAIAEGIERSRHRQKLILLADKSPYGWKTVEEYLQHELAEDSDDEKKIYRAEARAAKSTRKNFLSRQAVQKRNLISLAPQPTSSAVQGSPITTVISRGAAATTHKEAYGFKKTLPGACFACGKFGHWRYSCPIYHSASGASQASSKQ